MLRIRYSKLFVCHNSKTSIVQSKLYFFPKILRIKKFTTNSFQIHFAPNDNEQETLYDYLSFNLSDNDAEKQIWKNKIIELRKSFKTMNYTNQMIWLAHILSHTEKK